MCVIFCGNPNMNFEITILTSYIFSVTAHPKQNSDFISSQSASTVAKDIIYQNLGLSFLNLLCDLLFIYFYIIKNIFLLNVNPKKILLSTYKSIVGICPHILFGNSRFHYISFSGPLFRNISYKG